MKKNIYITLFIILFCILKLNVFAINNENYTYGTGTWYGGTPDIGRIGNSTMGDLMSGRSVKGVVGDLSNEIGIKWNYNIGKTDISSNLVYSGQDLNGDGSDDVFYVKGGKGYLTDFTSGLTLWESKSLGISKILSIEGVFGKDGKKQIIFQYGTNPYYIGILDGRSGELITTSETWGGLATSWSYDPNYIREESDGNNVIYTFYRWRSPLIGIKIYKNGENASVKLLYENRFNNSGTTTIVGTDDYSGVVRPMNLNGNKYFLISTSNKSYFLNPNEKYSGSTGNDYSMNIYDTFTISPSRSHGYNNNIFDFNGDGNDEFIQWINGISNYDQKTKLWVGGLYNGEIKNYWGISWPIGKNIEKVIPIKNKDNPEDSYLAIKISGENKYSFYKYSGNSVENYTDNISLGSNFDTEINSFNTNLVFEYDINTYGDILGIFDNNNGLNYVVTAKSGYHFFLFNGENTFNTDSSILITGNYYNFLSKIATDYTNSFYQREVKGGDTNSNGINEFAIYEGGYFKHYEILNNSALLVSEIEYANSEGPGYSSKLRGYTFDGGNLWSYKFDRGNFKIKIYNTNFGMNYSEMTSNSTPIYGEGKTSNITVFKNNGQNYINQGGNILDSHSASPNIPPTKIASIGGTDILYDSNGNNQTDVTDKTKTYSINSSYSKTQISSYYGLEGDFDGDNVLDYVYKYQDSDEIRKYYIKSGSDGSQLSPIIDSGNQSCAPIYYNKLNIGGTNYLLASRTRCSHQSRLINPTDGTTLQTLNNKNMVQIFEDNNGDVLVFGQDDDYSKYELQSYKVGASGLNTNFNTQIYSSMQGDYGGPVASINRDGNGVLNYGIKGLKGEVISLNENGNILFRSYYYNGKKYSSLSSIYNDGGIPQDHADAIVADINNDGTNEIVAAGFDGWVYIIDINNGDLLKTYNIGSYIYRLILADDNDSGKLSIIISSKDGYIYSLGNTVIEAPTNIYDGETIGVDIESQEDYKKSSLNFEAVTGADGYYVQLFNQTKGTAVFDWVDIGNQTSACIKSYGSDGDGCIELSTTFNLINYSIYQWRVRAYDSSNSSTIAVSNGFNIDNSELENILNVVVTNIASTVGNIFGDKNKYQKRNIKSYGSSLGVLLNDDSTPIEGSGTIDIATTNKSYKLVIGENTYLEGDSSILSQLLENYSCNSILSNGLSTGDGIYTVSPIGGEEFEVYCDMTTDGGGWTLVAVSYPTKNTYGNNVNRASSFSDFYTNEKDSIIDFNQEGLESGEVLNYSKRLALASNSNETLIKGITGSSDYYVFDGSINLGNRLVNSTERAKGKFYWDNKNEEYIRNDNWKTSMQEWGNNCGWIESIGGLDKNSLITSNKTGVEKDTCLNSSPENPITIGWFIR